MKPSSNPVQGKRITVRLTPETYTGLVILKLRVGTTIERLVEQACAELVEVETAELVESDVS